MYPCLVYEVSDLIQKEGVKVDAGMHNDLLTIIKNHGPSKDDSDKFKDIFWRRRQQQLKAAQSSFFEGLSLHAMAPSNNLVVSLPSPPFQWLLQHPEELWCFVSVTL